MAVLKHPFWAVLLVFSSSTLILSDNEHTDDYVPRSKRELVQKGLLDRDSCVEECSSDAKAQAAAATTENTHRLIAIGMQDAKANKHRLLLDNDEELRQQMHELTISNMGPLFDDLCEISRIADECLRKCGQSQLRDVTIADHNGVAFYCEPSMKWPSFTEYYIATDCLNRTILSKVCDGRCGREQNVITATRLQLSDNILHYDPDVKTNTKAASTACRTMICHSDCYEQIMKEQCGHKAFDMYKRIYHLGSKSALAILGLMNAIDKDIADCRTFYRK